MRTAPDGTRIYRNSQQKKKEAKRTSPKINTAQLRKRKALLAKIEALKPGEALSDQLTGEIASVWGRQLSDEERLFRKMDRTQSDLVESQDETFEQLAFSVLKKADPNADLNELERAIQEANQRAQAEEYQLALENATPARQTAMNMQRAIDMAEAVEAEKRSAEQVKQSRSEVLSALQRELIVVSLDSLSTSHDVWKVQAAIEVLSDPDSCPVQAAEVSRAALGVRTAREQSVLAAQTTAIAEQQSDLKSQAAELGLSLSSTPSQD